MNGIDCATKLTTTSAQALKQAGIEVVGRYLGRSLWNGLTLDEVMSIQSAGLALFLIWELAPTRVSYFDYAKGLSDARQAISEAEYLGAPHGIAIYFTVDYDAQTEDMSAIKGYFEGVRAGLEGKYLMGVYGSYSVMQAIKADRYFQTYAWSRGQKSSCHIYQYQNDVSLAGVQVDKDDVSSDAGLWEDNTMEKAVLIFTDEDYWAGKDVAKKLKCSIFIRDGAIPPDAMKAKQLIVIGGPSTGHSNEVLLSGNDKYDTAAVVKKYLG